MTAYAYTAGARRAGTSVVIDALRVRSPLLLVRDSDEPFAVHPADVDVAAFDAIDDLRPERLGWASPAIDATPVDVTWLPLQWLDDPDALAGHGLIAHRLASSLVVHAATASMAAAVARARDHFHAAEARRRRILGFFEMGRLTVREIGVTRDAPSVALFWIHMATAACIAAAVDGSRRLCPNVYTRVVSYFDPAEEAGVSVEGCVEALRLDADVSVARAAVLRLHDTVSRRCPEPDWPGPMRHSTRFEYRYWIDPRECTWRVAVADALAQAGRPADALHYLRFLAYATARAVMVWQRAREGRDVSYLRPERAVGPELRRICPEVLDDLDLALAGMVQPPFSVVERALARLGRLRIDTIDALQRSGTVLPDVVPWEPYAPLS